MKTEAQKLYDWIVLKRLEKDLKKEEEILEYYNQTKPLLPDEIILDSDMDLCEDEDVLTRQKDE